MGSEARELRIDVALAHVLPCCTASEGVGEPVRFLIINRISMSLDIDDLLLEALEAGEDEAASPPPPRAGCSKRQRVDHQEIQQARNAAAAAASTAARPAVAAAAAAAPPDWSPLTALSDPLLLRIMSRMSPQDLLVRAFAFISRRRGTGASSAIPRRSPLAPTLPPPPPHSHTPPPE